jgi:two-component system, chemotaxis family, sensor kinase CheA
VSTDDDFLIELQKEFLDELTFLLEQCEESYMKIEQPEARAEELAKIFRLAHSMKGAGAAVGFTDLAAFAHVVEDLLSLLRSNPNLVDTSVISVLLRTADAFKTRIASLKAKDAKPWDVEAFKQEIIQFTSGLQQRKALADSLAKSEEESAVPSAPTPLQEVSRNFEGVAIPPVKVEQTTIKVDSQRVETILNAVGELVVIKSQLINEAKEMPNHVRLHSVVGLLDKTIRDLQDRTLGMRLTPLKSLFLKMQRAARDLSVRLNKPIDFLMEGDDIEIDRNLVEQLADPLLHMIRNSVDHGIESPEQRKKVGKPEKGTVLLGAQQLGGRVLIRIEDDGAGIKRDRVVKKAIEQGLLPATAVAEKMQPSQVYDLLFAAGFSTADKVTDISGRGVGMNVVKSNIEKLKGKIEMESEAGVGTCIKVSVPLTTAISDGMLVDVDGQTYIIPIEGIRELVDLRESGVVQMQAGHQVLHVRGKYFPILCLSEHLDSSYTALVRGDHPQSKQKSHIVVIYEHENGLVALEVDKVLGQTQVVLKNLGTYFHQSEAISGAAILGNGKVALLLDIHGMVRAEADKAEKLQAA